MIAYIGGQMTAAAGLTPAPPPEVAPIVTLAAGYLFFRPKGDKDS